ncbi:prepilin peptidase [Candidatus Woesebacteria bacterium]|nr:prepilin peptidase [Candidatus Woesebacteria bacterium]
MNLVLIVIIFLLGTCIGSFVNVLVSRSIAGRDWLRGRSECDVCHKELSWYDMVPLLSFVAYKGRSRCCHKNLSMIHPIVEGLFGALFVWWLIVGFVFFQLATAPWTVIQPLFWLGVGIFLLIIAVADALYGVILMPFVYIASVWIYGYRVALALSGTYQWVDLGFTLLSGVLSFSFLQLLRIITKGRGMGDGDPYLAFVTGSLLSGMGAFWGMLLSFILGSIWGVGLIVMRVKKINQTIPFGPFLIAGSTLALLFIRF